jgi:hypothetical protein
LQKWRIIHQRKKSKLIPLKGKPWSFEEERRAWGQLSFPEISRDVDRGLTASQIQSYVAQKSRFNVSISRARKKFLFVASPLFFKSFPRTETELVAHFPFEDFFIRATADR